MDFIVTVSGANALALTRALEAYGAANAPLSEQQFLQKLVDGRLGSLVESYVSEEEQAALASATQVEAGG